MKRIAYFLLLILFSCSLFAEQVEYWRLTPNAQEEMDDGRYNAYSATFLSEKFSRLQLVIKGANQENLIAWVQLEEPQNLPFGQPLTLYIHQLHSQKGYIEVDDTKILCKMEWDAPEMDAYDFPLSEPSTASPFTLFGQTYWAYSGSILQNDPSYGQEICHLVGGDFDGVCWQVQGLDLFIQLEAADSAMHYQWSEKIVVYSEVIKSFPVGVMKNPFLKMCKSWEKSDEIIVFVHANYPGYRWIANLTRGGEAFFCRGGQCVQVHANLWEAITAD